MTEFLVLLHSISTNLSKDDLDHLKFLCRENISKRKLENVKSGIDLFGILMEQQEISNDNVDFLLNLLKNLKRGDLVEQLEQFVENGPGNVAEEPEEAQEREQLRIAFLVICENVGRHWKMLLRTLGVSEAKLDAIMAAHPNNLQEQLMQGLKAWQKSRGKDAKLSELLKALQNCRLKLVVDYIEEKLSKSLV
ncbi:FAS-associated death domain protein [Microcaecilia unicolor]|uniref:FAS-associated death domain protein n=1 Tax=Microcaecilia unicolor TaxID=1415580 RepID=A0A6P7Y0N1_9AMPH|nr:FAS-associated death domain protein [Microcaecilia unicolor]